MPLCKWQGISRVLAPPVALLTVKGWLLHSWLKHPMQLLVVGQLHLMALIHGVTASKSKEATLIPAANMAVRSRQEILWTRPHPNFIEDEDRKKKVMERIREACVKYSFFQIENHGIPLELLNRAMDLYKIFFDCSDEDKLLVSPKPGGTVPPAGYLKSPQHSDEKNEHLLILNASSGVSVYPKNPPQFKQVLEEMISHFTKLGVLLESIISECLGLPPNTLAKFNNDRSWDFLIGLHYFPATEAEDNGKSAHEDGNCITFVYQDEVGGLEVKKDGQWIPIAPSKHKLVVNIGDVIQALSNNKFKSATHRVVRPRGKSRYSYAFYYNLQGNKWVEPLPQFTKEIGESAKYKGFFYKEYVQLRARKWTHPPSRPEDLIHLTHYSISN